MTPFLALFSIAGTNVLMQLVKYVSGLRKTDNHAPVYLGGFLAFFSFLSALSVSYYTGEAVDPDSISSWLEAVTLAVVTFFASSGMYDKVWKPLLKKGVTIRN